MRAANGHTDGALVWVISVAPGWALSLAKAALCLVWRRHVKWAELEQSLDSGWATFQGGRRTQAVTPAALPTSSGAFASSAFAFLRVEPSLPRALLSDPMVLGMARGTCLCRTGELIIRLESPLSPRGRPPQRPHPRVTGSNVTPSLPILLSPPSQFPTDLFV